MRSTMETRFGHDFSDVRLHTDGLASESARGINALAYTVGHDIVFGAAQYAPSTKAGQGLLAHELAHVVQQSQTPVLIGGGLQIGATDTDQEREADSLSKEAGPPAVTSQSIGNSTGGQVVQRQGGSDVGSFFIRLNEKGSVEFLYGTPNIPVTGPLGVGFRCSGDRCEPVAGSDPASVEHKTYTVKEAADLLKGTAGGGSKPPNPQRCRPEQQTIFFRCCPEGTVPDESRLNCVPITTILTQRPCPPGQSRTIFGQCAPIQVPPVLPPAGTAPAPTLPPAPIDIGFNLDRPAAGEAGPAATASSLTAAGRTNLDSLVSLLNQNPAWKAQLVGRASPEGTSDYNLRLSERRAIMIAAALDGNGIGAFRLAATPNPGLPAGCEPIREGLFRCGEIGSTDESDREVRATIFTPAPSQTTPAPGTPTPE